MGLLEGLGGLGCVDETCVIQVHVRAHGTRMPAAINVLKL